MSDERKLAFNKRCYISHRPPFKTGEPLFYRCPECGAVMIHNFHPEVPSPKGLDIADKLPKISCCGIELEPLVPIEEKAVDPEHLIDFTIYGGFDNNSIYITVGGGSHPMKKDHCIEWIYYRTFQGGQLKYLPCKGRATAVFSFAEEDSFVYCDRDICKMGHEHCQFCCKRGNEIYAYCSVHGLIKLYMNGF